MFTVSCTLQTVTTPPVSVSTVAVFPSHTRNHGPSIRVYPGSLDPTYQECLQAKTKEVWDEAIASQWCGAGPPRGRADPGQEHARLGRDWGDGPGNHHRDWDGPHGSCR